MLVRVAQCSNRRSLDDYRQHRLASNGQPALRDHINAVHANCRSLERTTSSQINKLTKCKYFKAIRRVTSG
jgi:ribosomal protein S13